MKKHIKSTLLLASLLSFSFVLASCGNEEHVSSNPANSSLTSTPANSGKTSTVVKEGNVELTFDSAKGTVVADKTKGKVGDKVNLTITANEGFEIDSVTANAKTLTGPNYRFTLVEGANKVNVAFKAKETLPQEEHSITPSTSDDYTISDLSATSAKEGTKITFKVQVTDATKNEISLVKANDVACTLDGDTYSFTMLNEDVTISVEVKSVEAKNYTLKILSDKETYLEGSGAAILTASFGTDTPTVASYTWDQSKLNGIGVITSQEDKSTVHFTPTRAGKGEISVTAVVDGKEYTASLSITVEADYSSYTKISTADELLDLLSKKGTISDKYLLEANIDLGGAVINGRKNGSTFSGVLDGNGYTIKNFTVKNEDGEEAPKVAGLFHVFTGALTNIHISGTIDGAGFSGLLAKEVSGNARISDCVFEATNVYQSTDWTWDRNGVIASTFQGDVVVENVVTNLDAGTTGASCLPFFAYSWSDKQVMTNAYTNIAHDDEHENWKPFNPDNTVDVSKQQITNVHYTPFDSTPASAYTTLDSKIWKLEDNKMPVLLHDADAFVTPTK